MMMFGRKPASTYPNFAQAPGSNPDVTVTVLNGNGSETTDEFVPFIKTDEKGSGWSHSFHILDGGVLQVSLTKWSRTDPTKEVWTRGTEWPARLYSPSRWATVEGRKGQAKAPTKPTAPAAD